MEEKKFDKDINVRNKTESTDEEIDVGLIERSVEREKYLTVWLYKDSSWKSYSMSKILDLIHRLQGENAEQNAEIELLKINLANEKKWGKIQAKQAEKETAREILVDIESCIEGMLDGERYMTKNEVEYLLEYILNKKQEYDVEVYYEN